MAASWISCLLVTTVSYYHVYGQQGQLLKPCAMTDLECIRSTTQEFLENTSRGIPEFNIKAIDPMLIPILNYDVDKEALIKYELEDVTVKGLKNLTVTDFQMDTVTKQVQISMLLNIQIDGNIIVKFNTIPKGSLEGTYHASCNGAIAEASYAYDMIKDEQDVEHFDVGPETISYRIPNIPATELNEELAQALRSDERATFDQTDANREVVRKLLKKAVPILVQNLRQAARILPKTAFFLDAKK